MKGWLFMLWDIDVSCSLEMTKDISDLPIAEVHISRDFINGHCCTKANNNLLDSTGDSLTLRHGGM